MEYVLWLEVGDESDVHDVVNNAIAAGFDCSVMFSSTNTMLRTQSLNVVKALITKLSIKIKDISNKDAVLSQLIIDKCIHGRDCAEVISLLISLGANIDAMILIELVKRKCPLGEFQYVIGLGADINVKNKITLLQHTLYAGRLDIFRLLLKSGVDVNGTDDRMNTIMHTIVENTVFTKKFLQDVIGLGANLNAQNINGMTPLNTACAVGNTRAVRILVRSGADVNTRDNKGKSVIDTFDLHTFTNIVELLTHGAQSSDKHVNNILKQCMQDLNWAGQRELIQQNFRRHVLRRIALQHDKIMYADGAIGARILSYRHKLRNMVPDVYAVMAREDGDICDFLGINTPEKIGIINDFGT